MKPSNKYNLFIFLSIFARFLVEVFIPIILYKMGMDIKEIILFFVFCFGFNLILAPIVNFIGNKISYKWILILSAFLFVLMYYALNTKVSIYLIALLYSSNNTFYYLGKHNYADLAITNNHIATKVGKLLIVTILATIPSSLIGSFLIEKISIEITSLIILFLYIIAIIPLFFIKEKKHKHDKLLKMLKNIPKTNIIYFSLTQFKILFLLLFPLYIFINIKSKYSFIGSLNFIVGIASIIFIYFYSKKMDKDNKNYIFFAATLLSIILFIEINIKSSFILLFTSVIEGLVTKLYEVSSSRDFYFVDKKYDKSCYFLANELINNFTKMSLLLIFYLLNLNLYSILFILILGIFGSGIVKFQVPKN